MCRSVKPSLTSITSAYRVGMSESMSDEEKRHDQLTRAPKSSESDAAPRIRVSTAPSGATRIDVAETAAVRPGNPDKQNG